MEKRNQFCYPSKKSELREHKHQRMRARMSCLERGDPYTISVRVKRRKRRDRKFREGKALLDKYDDAVASVRGIRRENVRPGVGTIRSQSRKSRKRGR